MPGVCQQLTVRGRLCVRELQAASPQMSMSPRMSWAQTLHPLSPTSISSLEGRGQANQQEAWLNPASLRELHSLTSPWQRRGQLTCQAAEGDGSREPAAQGGTGERRPVSTLPFYRRLPQVTS